MKRSSQNDRFMVRSPDILQVVHFAMQGMAREQRIHMQAHLSRRKQTGLGCKVSADVMAGDYGRKGCRASDGSLLVIASYGHHICARLE